MEGILSSEPFVFGDVLEYFLVSYSFCHALLENFTDMITFDYVRTGRLLNNSVSGGVIVNAKLSSLSVE